MQVKSKLIEIEKTKNPTVEYFEEQFTKLNINPLRWAVVHVSDKMYKVSCANLIK